MFLNHKKLEAEKRRTDGYKIFLKGYAQPPFSDFESYLRTVVGSDEDDVL